MTNWMVLRRDATGESGGGVTGLRSVGGTLAG